VRAFVWLDTFLAIVRAVRRRAGQCFGSLLWATLLSTPSAQANSADITEPVAAWMEIEQAPGSELCPDKEAVFRSIARLFPERQFQQSSDAPHSTAGARVSIRPLSPGHEAVLTLLPPRQGERVILDPDPDCRGLADALALAFVMLVAPPDSKTEAVNLDRTPTPPPAANPEAAVTTPPRRTSEPKEGRRSAESVAPTRTERRTFRAAVAASVVGGLGTLSKPALGGAGELQLFHESGWGLSAQGLRLWSQPANGEGGSVTLTLWGLLVAPCYRQRLSASSSLDGCLGLGVGSQHAEVEGFSSPQSGAFPWLVLVPRISYQRHVEELLSEFVRVGLVGQLRPQSFSVRFADTGQTAQLASAPKVGVMAEIGLSLGADVF